MFTPDWLTRARFEIDAKLPPNASTDQIPEMLQALLTERFKLQVTRETKAQMASQGYQAAFCAGKEL